MLAFVARASQSERVAESELEGSRPAGTEELARRVEGVVESWRVNGIVASGVVPVGRAPDVGYVEQVEPFSDELECVRFGEVNVLVSRMSIELKESPNFGLVLQTGHDAVTRVPSPGPLQGTGPAVLPLARQVGSRL